MIKKVIQNIIKDIPLIYIHFKLLESIYKVIDGNFFLGTKQIIAFIVVFIIDILLMFKRNKLGILLFFLFLLFCVTDLLRFTVQTIKSEKSFYINNLEIGFSFQPYALLLLVLFIALNYKEIQKMIKYKS
jgi:hypothetical protein